MLRLLLLSPLAGVFAAGGVVLADDAGIVDPWPSSVFSWLATAPSEPASAIALSPEPVRARPEATPSVLPLAASPGGDHTIIVEPWSPQPFEALADPWVSAREARVTPPAPVTVVSRRHQDWAYPIHEIIDPWRPGYGAVSRDPLIADPWAK